jgi:hypothetical protein
MDTAMDTALDDMAVDTAFHMALDMALDAAFDMAKGPYRAVRPLSGGRVLPSGERCCGW